MLVNHSILYFGDQDLVWWVGSIAGWMKIVCM